MSVDWCDHPSMEGLHDHPHNPERWLCMSCFTLMWNFVGDLLPLDYPDSDLLEKALLIRFGPPSASTWKVASDTGSMSHGPWGWRAYVPNPDGSQTLMTGHNSTVQEALAAVLAAGIEPPE